MFDNVLMFDFVYFRSLGTHVSKVRSLTLDKWSSINLQLLERIGNNRSNDIWERSLRTKRASGSASGSDSDGSNRESSSDNSAVEQLSNNSGGAAGAGPGRAVAPVLSLLPPKPVHTSNRGRRRWRWKWNIVL